MLGMLGMKSHRDSTLPDGCIGTGGNIWGSGSLLEEVWASEQGLMTPRDASYKVSTRLSQVDISIQDNLPGHPSDRESICGLAHRQPKASTDIQSVQTEKATNAIR